MTKALRIPMSLVLLAGTFTLGCGGPASDSAAAPSDSSRITVTGSSTIAPLMSEIGKRFEKSHPGMRVDVQTGGSSRGIADARSGMAEIGMVSRDLVPDERDLRVFPIARDGVCLIVHADNPVPALTREQVVGIYTGQIRNWRDAGGADAPITVVNKAEGRSTLEIFTGYYQLKPNLIRADVVIGDNEQGVKTVAGNPLAIGYVSIGTAEFDRDSGVPIRLLPLEGIEATVANVRNGSFPMSRSLNLVTRASPTGRVEELIGFATSAQVHDLIKELSFAPLD